MKLLFLDIDGVLNSEKYAIWCTENDIKNIKQILNIVQNN